MSKSKIIFGLGNPGTEYESTYHNAGRLFLDFLAKKIAPENQWETAKKEGFEFLRADGMILIKSLGFMNESGQTARLALKRFDSGPENLVVVHDDSDIGLGSYKLSDDRGSAGHKGTQSIIDYLKTQSFLRIRIGVRPSNQKSQAGDFVLKTISKPNMLALKKVFSEILACHFESNDKGD
ncbi:MAG: aminoacyl-tRNA hydrolase [Patescibacteria group bacterium]|nr:aminoacyl-tRNA hydrolase [Patescibacteria group bacterium]MCL5261698.1 aminoacyl-tRNA hydrolase [Patescibacteria group bacterium]